MIINNNVGALNTYSKLTATNSAKDKSLEKLSSGLRINRAADDAAGLAISEKMRAQINGLNQAKRNAQDGVSLIQTAEGGLTETHSMLQRMRELTVQASNDTLTSTDRSNIQTEIKNLTEEITRIGNDTEFNGKNILNGSLVTSLHGTTNADSGANTTISVEGAEAGTYSVAVSGTEVTIKDSNGIGQTIDVGAATITGGNSITFDQFGIEIKAVGGAITLASDLGGSGASDSIVVTGSDLELQIGANSSQNLSVSIADMRANALGTGASGLSGGATVTDLSKVTVEGDADDISDSLKVIDKAIDDVSTQRAKLGAYQNRLDHTMNNLTTSSENLTSAESRIRDVDMAEEMMEFTKNNILSQAATSMLAQANQAGQNVLSLLR